MDHWQWPRSVLTQRVPLRQPTAAVAAAATGNQKADNAIHQRRGSLGKASADRRTLTAACSV